MYLIRHNRIIGHDHRVPKEIVIFIIKVIKITAWLYSVSVSGRIKKLRKRNLLFGHTRSLLIKWHFSSQINTIFGLFEVIRLLQHILTTDCYVTTATGNYYTNSYPSPQLDSLTFH